MKHMYQPPLDEPQVPEPPAWLIERAKIPPSEAELDEIEAYLREAAELSWDPNIDLDACDEVRTADAGTQCQELELWSGSGPWPIPAGGPVPAGMAPSRDAAHAPVDVQALGRQMPDSSTVAALERIDPERTDPYALLEAIAAWQRVQSWSTFQLRALAATLADKPQMHIHGEIPDGLRQLERNMAADELAARLGCARRTAERYITYGRAWNAGTANPAGYSLRLGNIDTRKAEQIADAVATVPWQIALGVQEDVLPHAGTRTHAQLSRDLTKALASHDPEDFNERCQRARATRRVNKPKALPDGMCSTLIVWPATDAVALDTALDAAARTAKAGGDTRAMDQLRADALAAMAGTALATGCIGAPKAPDTGTIGTFGERRNDVGTGAGDAGSLASDTSGAGAEAPQTYFPLGELGGRRAHISLTVPLSTALGGHEPGTLDGYGPIPADVTRAIAAGGTWRRIVTDPLTDKVIDAGATGYRPPAELRERILANEPHCIGPSCGVSSRLCDLDHIQPWPLGPTTEDNLAPLCRRHHVLRTHGAFDYTNPEPGVYEWTTRTGQRYRRERNGTTTLTDDGEPPF